MSSYRSLLSFNLYKRKVSNGYLYTSSKIQERVGIRFLSYISLLPVGTLLYCQASSVLASDKPLHHTSGNLNFLSHHNNGTASWLDGGLGRFTHDDDTSAAIEANLAYRYRPSSRFQIRTHLQAQWFSHDNSATDAGIVELEARYKHDLDFNQQLAFRFGQFFLPISMENTQRFWESPYTINFSSLNSWIGEEFRPIGADMAYTYHFDGNRSLLAAATVFGGNDSLGALLAYRGWTYGRIRTAFNDVLSLPDLQGLSDAGRFSGQRDDGSKPFGKDLDGRPGYATRIQYLSDRLVVNLTWVDNQGDTRLHHGEYAWRTRFAVIGASWFQSEQLELLAEFSQGDSTMGVGPGVDIDVYSAYAMAAYSFSDYRISFRYDVFGVDDVDSVDEQNHDLGRSQTLALMWSPSEQNLSAGFELLYLNSKRSRLLEGGITQKDTDAFAITALLQYRY